MKKQFLKKLTAFTFILLLSTSIVIAAPDGNTTPGDPIGDDWPSDGGGSDNNSDTVHTGHDVINLQQEYNRHECYIYYETPRYCRDCKVYLSPIVDQKIHSPIKFKTVIKTETGSYDCMKKNVSYKYCYYCPDNLISIDVGETYYEHEFTVDKVIDHYEYNSSTDKHRAVYRGICERCPKYGISYGDWIPGPAPN